MFVGTRRGGRQRLQTGREDRVRLSMTMKKNGIIQGKARRGSGLKTGRKEKFCSRAARRKRETPSREEEAPFLLKGADSAVNGDTDRIFRRRGPTCPIGKGLRFERPGMKRKGNRAGGRKKIKQTG